MEPIRYEGRRLAVFRVQGDTAAPVFFDGEPVLIEPTEPGTPLRREEIYLLRGRGEGWVLRRVEDTKDGFLLLLPLNPSIPPQRVRADQVEIAGRVVRTEKQKWYERVLGPLGRR